MEQLVYALPLLACGGMMALCMWLMNRGGSHRGQQSQAQPDPAEAHTPQRTQERLAELEEEMHRLRAELRLRDHLRDQTPNP